MRKTKFGNIRTEFNGRKYDSKAEARRARQLDQLLKAGEIAYVSPQPTFHLHGGVTYKPDFLVQDATGATWIEEVKGMETARFRMIRKLWMADGAPLFPLHILKAKGAGQRWKIEILEREP